MVLTARSENHLHGIDDLDDTIARLVAYAAAGADAVYAPWISTVEQISAVVDAVGVPVNVLATPAVPPIPELAELGVRRISTGSLLAGVAYGAAAAAARDLHGGSTSTYAANRISEADKQAAFGSGSTP
jgi:2-methylisocitrate lyase-like PEP mutase family enzyme